MLKTFGPGRMILHNAPYEAISVTVDKDTPGVIEDAGRKMLPAGTILGGADGTIFDKRDQKVKKAMQATDTMDGVLLSNTDVTDGDQVVSLVYRGTVRLDLLGDANEKAVLDEAKKKLPHLVFVKGV
ncbi:MAG: hypothetical protein Q4A67_07160 [Aerococcus sp.]|nr:hypothetical protein [Aerococcus sp.]